MFVKHTKTSGRATGLYLTAAALVLGSGLTLTGCANHSKKHFTVGSVPDDYRTRHPIVISEQEQTLDVPVASGAYDIPFAVKSSIEGFADDFAKSASGNITVLMPSGSVNERAAQKVGNKIIAIIRAQGVPSRRILTAPYFAGEQGAAAPVRLSYAAIQANVDGCGQWPEDLSRSPENRQYHNFGCASQNNLAQMVANPSDLLGPRGTTEIDAARRSDVITKYRKGEDPSTIYNE
jgi:pilus assembly protein CpaD